MATTTKHARAAVRRLDDAIHESIIRDRIVTLDDATQAEMSEAMARCDDSVRTTAPAIGPDDAPLRMTEYWGVEDGDSWRVHLVTSAEEGGEK